MPIVPIDKHVTAGEKSVKALSDSTKYDPLEVAHALTDGIYEQLMICAKRHEPIFLEEEYFVLLIVAYDPLIKGVRRHKYAALMHLPKPRPQQSVFLYNRKTQALKFLWSIPDAKVMATISSMDYVDPKWQRTKRWCDSFYAGTFHEDIRKDHDIKHLSEEEFLIANREELVKACGKDLKPGVAEPFDFSKVTVKQIVDTKTAVLD